MKFIQETTNVKLFTQYLFCIESSANSSHQRTTRIIHQREQTANNERTKRQRDCGCVFTPLYSPKSTWPLLYKSPIGGAGGRGSLPHESRELISPKGGHRNQGCLEFHGLSKAGDLPHVGSPEPEQKLFRI